MKFTTTSSSLRVQRGNPLTFLDHFAKARDDENTLSSSLLLLPSLRSPLSSPLSSLSSPRRRGSMIHQYFMDSRLRGNDNNVCGDDNDISSLASFSANPLTFLDHFAKACNDFMDSRLRGNDNNVCGDDNAISSLASFSANPLTFLYFLLIMLFAYPAAAMTIPEIKTTVEERIEQDYGIKHVILHTQHTLLLNNLNNLEYITYQSSDKPGQIIVTIRLEEVEHQFLASWQEAALLPTLLERKTKGYVITASDLIYSKIAAKIASRDYISDEKELIGKALKRNIEARKPLKKTDLSSPTMVEKGDRITVRYEKKSLIIENTCIAMEAGGENDTIKLKNPDSNKILYGRVINKDLVTIQ